MIIVPQSLESSQKSWDDLQKYTWILAMIDTPQDPEYHGEGDVHIHTKMVLDALVESPDWQGLDRPAQEILYLAAVLHDVAKPITTMIKPNGRIGHPHHSPKGAVMARKIMWEMGYSFEVREAVCGLIRYHQVPFWLIVEDDSEYRLAKISHMTRCDWLAILAKADLLGRVCTDTDKILEHIELFTMLADEKNCLSQPIKFIDNYTQYKYYQKTCLSRMDKMFDPTWGEVIILCGLPGSGKDTWIRTHVELPVVSLDDLRRSRSIDHADKVGTGRIRQECLEMARQYLRAKKPFVWNATNIQRTRRQPLVDLCMRYGATVRIVYVEASKGKLFHQNNNREHTVPERAIQKMMRSWDLPTPFEAPIVEYWVDGERLNIL